MSQRLAILYDWDPGAGVDLRHLGESLLGMERIVTAGLFAVENGRFPRGREQSPFAIRVSATYPGSAEFDLVMHVGGLLLLYSLFQEDTRSILSDWIMWALKKVAGRENEATVHFDKFMDLLQTVERDRHLEVMGIRRNLENMDTRRLHSHARDAVAPIGRSCSRIGLSEFPGGRDREIIDESLAREIRRRSSTYTSDPEGMRVRVDGFSRHDRRLRIEDPEDPDRFISAEIVDPDFSELSNVYVEAAARREYLDVMAKVTYRAGRVAGLYILHASGPFRTRDA